MLYDMNSLNKSYFENGCPWNEESCEKASYGGHLEVLKYLHENGCRPSLIQQCCIL